MGTGKLTKVPFTIRVQRSPPPEKQKLKLKLACECRASTRTHCTYSRVLVDDPFSSVYDSEANVSIAAFLDMSGCQSERKKHNLKHQTCSLGCFHGMLSLSVSSFHLGIFFTQTLPSTVNPRQHSMPHCLRSPDSKGTLW